MTGNPKDPSDRGKEDSEEREEATVELDSAPEVEQDLAPPPQAPAKSAPPQNLELDLPAPAPVSSAPITLEREENRLRRHSDHSPRAPSSSEISKMITDGGGISWAWYLAFVVALGPVAFAAYKLYKSGEKVEIVHMPTEDQKPLPLSKQVVSSSTASPSATAAPDAPLPALVPVRINTNLVGFEVFVNGRPATAVNNQFEAPEGRSEITIRKIGFEPYVTTLVATSAGENVVQPVFVHEKAKGFLAYETTPEAKLMLYQGEKLLFEKTTPFAGFSLPVGKYRAVLENTLIGYKSEEEIEITAWQTTVLRKNLQTNP